MNRVENEPEPEEVLRALLAISSEDAAEVREVADVKAKPDAQLSSDVARKGVGGRAGSETE